MKPLASNTLLQNRYLVVHLIGRGGMGEVYLSIDQRLGSAVALKRTVFFDDEMLGNAFEREAKILARLRHAVLPKVSDHFIEDGNQYLVMEYIAGDDLSKRLELQNKPFPLEWVMFWADRILDALDYLHSNEPPIVHRDIKPQNLKLTEDNQIVLLDFGLSKNTVAASSFSTSAAPSVVGYTPQYAPMEQIRGTGTNARSDIFSLSSTLYQLLTDTIPPDALTRADAILGGKPDPLASPTELNPQITPSISEIILKGMEISQDKRISSAREMQKLLRDVFSSEIQNQISAQAAFFGSQTSATGENISLKTNVTSTPIIEARDGESKTKSASSDLPPSPSFVENYNSSSFPKPVSKTDLTAGNFKGSVFPASASYPDERRTDFAVASSAEKTANKKSMLVFACVGAFLLAFWAIGFGFYKYNFAASTIKNAAPETAPQSTTEAIVKPSIENPNAENEVFPNKIAGEEKQPNEASEDYKNAKTLQPPMGKINQKSAQSPDAKSIKPVVKAAAKTEQKPTPLPPILP